MLQMTSGHVTDDMIMLLFRPQTAQTAVNSYDLIMTQPVTNRLVDLGRPCLNLLGSVDNLAPAGCVIWGFGQHLGPNLSVAQCLVRQ